MYILADRRLSLFVFIYRQISNISRPKSPHLNRSSSRLAVVFVQFIGVSCWVDNEDVATSEWSDEQWTALLPIEGR